MLLLLALTIFCISTYLLTHKVRNRTHRKWIGLAMVTLGGTTTFGLNGEIDDTYIYGFLAVWFIGLELFFNRNEYADED